MQLVRYQKENKINYGSLKDGMISKIEGNPFDSYKITDIKEKIEDVKLLIPCIPTNLYCVGLNFMDHINELGLPTPEQPANFLKPVTGICNPGENIEIPKVAKRVDYEGEMAIIIKDKIKDISIEEASKHIFGITPLNDVTEREMSYVSTQVTYSKSFDTFTSFGPIIDTTLDPENVTIRTYQNGEKVQEACTSDYLFSAAYCVSYFSQGRTLYPGDVISLGTPCHVQAMKDGDVVEVELEGLELRLRNHVSK
ncbi:MAG: fumarylacetoacetate hydrolase family protein [Pleomorphochaeta sp.]